MKSLRPGSADLRPARCGPSMTTIAVIGAGFSGTLLTLHLLRRCPPPIRLVLIERNSQFGRGLAYATGNASHILNVPAGRMSAFHDRPNDFLDWLSRQPESETGTTVGPGTFAPRRLFGAYIRALLNEEIKRSGRERLELVKGDVIGLDRTAHPLVLTLDRNRTVQADLAVLATGNFPPEPMPIANPNFYDTPLYRPDPWAAEALTDLDVDASVLLVGTGLTTVDAVISLLDQGHRGPIHALSRRGLLPRRHAGVPAPAPEHEPFPTAVNALTRFLRNETGSGHRAGQRLAAGDRRTAAVHGGCLAGDAVARPQAVPAPSAAVVGRASAPYGGAGRRPDRRGARQRGSYASRSGACAIMRSAAMSWRCITGRGVRMNSRRSWFPASSIVPVRAPTMTVSRNR